MDLVIDANILFAALIRDGLTSEMLFKHTLFAPEFIFDEFRKYKDEIKEKTHRTEAEFEELFELFERNVILVPKEEIEPFLEKGEKISPDLKDAPYIALALKQNCAVWSNDKQLRKQKDVRVIHTEELIEISK